MKGKMTEGHPLPILLKFMLPLFVGNLFQQVYNAVDSVIVGNYVGADALAAVGSTGTVMFLMNGLAMGLTSGFTILVSQKFGEGDEEGTRRSVGNGTTLSILVVALLTLVFAVLMKPLLTLMNTPENIFDMAYAYISVICGGMFCMVGYNYFSSTLRAIGNSRIPVLTLVFSACLNVVLDLAFVLGLGMGTSGAAWATVIAQGCSMLLCIFYIMKKEPVVRPRKEHFRLDRFYSRNQLQIGIPMALQFGITASGTMVMQTACNLFGSLAVSAFSAASRVQGLFFQGMMSMGQTMATYAGQNFGARRIDRIRQGVRWASLVELIYGGVSALVMYFGLPYYIGLFYSADTDMAAVMGYAKTVMFWWAVFFIPLAQIFHFRNAMQGCGFGFLPMLGGVVEMVIRVAISLVAMRTMQFYLVPLCDSLAWLGAFFWFIGSYLFVMKRIERAMPAAPAP